ncbi:MAG: STAS domain-containing protein [Acidimicrobiales bacterium]
MEPKSTRLSIVVPDPATLLLDGEIDLHTAGEFRHHLTVLDASADNVVDLARVSFIDSSGLRAFIEAHRRHGETGGRPVLRQPSDVVVSLFTMTGLIGRLDLDRHDVA